MGDRLDSWKEIASYLRRALRTVQLWEKREGLPVHRHTHNSLASVYAFKLEVDAWWSGRPSQPQPARTRFILAVLPFEASGNNAKEESMSRGLADEILVRLTCLCPPDIRVVSGRATMCCKRSGDPIETMASDLGVTHFIEGVVRREGSWSCVTVQLTNAHDQSSVWAERYRRDGAFALPLQKEMSQHIAASVIARLVPRRKISAVQNVSSIAQQAYLTGRFYWNRRTAEGLAKAITYFEQALQEDPSCALAYTGLADSYAQLGFYGITPSGAARDKARSAAVKALELDQTLGEAHASYADVMTYVDWNLLSAEGEYQRAIQLNPGYATAYHWYADYLAIMGRLDEAIAYGHRALELDPVSPIINVWLGMKYYLGGHYREALEQYRKTLDMHPAYALAHWGLGLVYEQERMFERAIAEKRRALSLSNNSNWMAAGLAYSYALSGKKKKAQAIVDRLTTLPQHSAAVSYEIATIYAGMLDEDRAVQWLDKAYHNHSYWMPYMNVEPRLKSLHGEPGFKNLLSRFGLQVGRSQSDPKREILAAC